MSSETQIPDLSSVRFRFSSEKGLQDAMERFYREVGSPYAREYSLGDGDVVDFYLPACRVAVEVKVDGSLSAVTRQLHRYATHSEVAAVTLVTTLRRHDRMPKVMNNKLVTVIVILGGLS